MSIISVNHSSYFTFKTYRISCLCCIENI